MVVTVIALILAACWPAIRVSLGYAGTAMLPATAAPDTASPAAPAAVSTTARPTPNLTPGRLSWSPEPVALNVPTVIQATGAEPSWPSYINITADPANDLAAYEVHRGTNSDFTPSAATVNAHDTSFADTSASASNSPYAGDYF
jgi:hypothetical protein